MRSIVIPLIVTFAVTSASAQVSRTGTGSADHNATGRTIIPEKIGKPLRLKSSDVKLRPADDRTTLPSAPHARSGQRAK
jgi:hypothetical protein